MLKPRVHLLAVEIETVLQEDFIDKGAWVVVSGPSKAFMNRYLYKNPTPLNAKP